MLYSRLRRQFVIFGIALLAAGQGAPYCSGRSILNPDGAASIKTKIAQPLAGKAGFIFSGMVLSVERVSAAAGAGIDTIRIIFAVHEGTRGVRSGKTFTMQEWAGLWSMGGGHFRVGERVLLLLYPRSKLGLTSVVGGSLGRFPLDSQWRIVGTRQNLGDLPVSAQRPGASPTAQRGGTPVQRPNNKIRPWME